MSSDHLVGEHAPFVFPSSLAPLLPCPIAAWSTAVKHNPAYSLIPKIFGTVSRMELHMNSWTGPRKWRCIPPSFLIQVHNKYMCKIVFVQPKPIQHRNGIGNDVKSMDRKITKQDIGSCRGITNRACVKITASCTYHYHRGRSLVHRLHTHPHTKPHSVKALSQKGNIKLDTYAILICPTIYIDFFCCHGD